MTIGLNRSLPLMVRNVSVITKRGFLTVKRELDRRSRFSMPSAPIMRQSMCPFPMPTRVSTASNGLPSMDVGRSLFPSSGPLRTTFKDTSPWETASRILNKTLRYGGESVHFQRGGWVDVYSVLSIVNRDLRNWHTPEIVKEAATVHWLFALMFDTYKYDPSVKSRYRLAGVVDNDGILVQICYVRNKSGHSSKEARFIPDETIYTKSLKSISITSRASVTRRSSRTSSIFAISLVPGGGQQHEQSCSHQLHPLSSFRHEEHGAGKAGWEFNVVIVFKP